MKTVVFSLLAGVALCSLSFLMTSLILGLADWGVLFACLASLSGIGAVLVEPTTAQEKRRDGGTY